jgi:Holliday junction resolvasome RuvABC endonuclease subunit
MLLAIDPSFSNFGYAMLDEKLDVVDVGVWITERDKNKKTRTSDDDSFRAQQLARLIGEYIIKNNIRGIMGERPSGAQTAMALKSFCTANTIVDCISALMGLPVEWCTPGETKKGFVGRKSAGKKEIMEAVAKYYNWKVGEKKVKTKKGERIDKVYYPLGIKMGAGKFEHIADALSAFQFLKSGSSIVKLYAKTALVA